MSVSSYSDLEKVVGLSASLRMTEIDKGYSPNKYDGEEEAKVAFGRILSARKRYDTHLNPANSLLNICHQIEEGNLEDRARGLSAFDLAL